MKTSMTKGYTLKTATFVLAIALNASAASVMALEAYETDNATITNDWQTPLAAEFSKLDTSGNGLVMPNEASKDKAFNKKTFAAADADHDGTIDQAEYIQYKSVTAPQDAS